MDKYRRLLSCKNVRCYSGSKGLNMENYSVLMSVYHGEKAEYLRLSINSIFAQTVPTNDFVLVCDGPLTEELDAVIEEFVQEYGNILRVIRLKENRGLSEALNVGIQKCKNELVARMDTDDVAVADRCAWQVSKFEEDPGLTIVGGDVDEFENTPNNVVSHKSMPRTHAEIMKYARGRNPFNHPTVMYKKTAVLDAGGYPNRMLHEDYALWANLLVHGKKGCNLPQTLCYMRVGSGLYRRRGGWSYLKTAVKLRWHLHQIGLYTFGDFLFACAPVCITSLLPTFARKFVYRNILR